MADAYYAWSEVLTNGDKPNHKVGDTVTASSLGVSEEDFQQFVDSGAVRTEKFPDIDPAFQGSPDEFRISEFAKASRGEPTWADSKKSAPNTAEKK